MKRYNISQMPIIDNGMPVGLISESTIISKMSEIEDPAELKHLVVSDVMEDLVQTMTKEQRIEINENPY